MLYFNQFSYWNVKLTFYVSANPHGKIVVVVETLGVVEAGSAVQ